MKDSYTAIIVQGYDSEDALGNMSSVVQFELIENDPEKALERAKKLVDKKFYRISKIIEVLKK